MNIKRLFDRRESLPEVDIDHLLARLRGALGDGLLSVSIFGSMASGEFQPQRSDINLLVVLKDVSLKTMRQLHPALKPWLALGHPMPVLLQSNEIEIYARSLPIEFYDVIEHHRVVLGTDFFLPSLANRDHLRYQCEYELSVKQLKIRQALAGSGAPAEALRSLLVDSLPSILTLFRAVLRLDEDVSRMNKLEAGLRLAGKMGRDPMILQRLHDLRIRRESDDLDELAHRYLELIEDALQLIRSRG